MTKFMALLLLPTLVVGTVSAETLRLLSTGAVEPGIKAAAEQFQNATGHTFDITYRTAPQVAEALKAGERWDLVVATPPTIELHTGAGLLAPGSVVLGRVGIGVAARRGAAKPDVSTADAVRRAVLDAEAVMFSRGSTGLYTENLLKNLGVYSQIERRIVRRDRGAEVLQRLSEGQGREIAFGALTEIALSSREVPVDLVAPLPESLQNYTTYVIAPMSGAMKPAVATEFLKFLATPQSRAIFEDAGIAP